MQNAVRLHMAPIHGHFGPDEISPHFQDTNAKGAGQAIGHARFNGLRGCRAFPDAHA
jgi:hypothetical protein